MREHAAGGERRRVEDLASVHGSLADLSREGEGRAMSPGGFLPGFEIREDIATPRPQSRYRREAEADRRSCCCTATRKPT